MTDESVVGWLKLFFQVFTTGFILLIIAYYTLDVFILLILAIISGILAIISLIVAYIISKVKKIKLRESKIDYDKVLDWIRIGKPRRR